MRTRGRENRVSFGKTGLGADQARCFILRAAENHFRVLNRRVAWSGLYL